LPMVRARMCRDTPRSRAEYALCSVSRWCVDAPSRARAVSCPKSSCSTHDHPPTSHPDPGTPVSDDLTTRTRR
jgi:hypothetical protein